MSSWRVVLGVGLVVIGGLLLLGQLGFADAGEIVRRWWPLAIVLLGLLQGLASRGALVGPAVLIVIGLVLLLDTLDLVRGSAFAILWPLILVAIGAAIVFNRRGASGVQPATRTP